jgi:hypothetical protein
MRHLNMRRSYFERSKLRKYFALLKRGNHKESRYLQPLGLRTVGFHEILLLPEQEQSHSTSSKFIAALLSERIAGKEVRGTGRLPLSSTTTRK